MRGGDRRVAIWPMYAAAPPESTFAMLGENCTRCEAYHERPEVEAKWYETSPTQSKRKGTTHWR
jgi:hypothetical protein